MDLTDWESPNPGLLHAPSDDAEWDNVFARYTGTTNDGPLLRCIAVARENGAKSVVVETRYLGSDFRSEFAHFYSRTFAGVPDSAHRIHFFTEALDASRLLHLDDGVGYLGYVVIRPSPLGAVARAMLRPPRNYADAVRTAVSEEVHLFGQPLSVDGVPFSQQDARLGACAHSSAWMCHTVAALRGVVPMRPTGDFAVEADSSLLPARSMPTSGLTVAQLSDLMRRFNLPPMFYLIGSLPDIGLPTTPPPPTPDPTRAPGSWDTRIVPTVCRHLNGGNPVLVGTQDHAFVLCGWWREDGVVRLLRHDDQQGPYLPVHDPLNDDLVHPQTGSRRSYGPWVSLHVPMPSKAWLLPESAERQGGAFLLAASTPYVSKVNAATGSNLVDMNTLVAEDRVGFRTYVSASSAYKAQLAQRGWSAPALDIVRLARMPRYVVVVEAVDRSLREAGSPCVLAEAVFDATSADALPEIVAARVHGVVTTYTDGRVTRGPLLSDASPVSSGAVGSP